MRIRLPTYAAMALLLAAACSEESPTNPTPSNPAANAPVLELDSATTTGWPTDTAPPFLESDSSLGSDTTSAPSHSVSREAGAAEGISGALAPSLSVSGSNAATTLVVNGGFESGFAGWTRSATGFGYNGNNAIAWIVGSADRNSYSGGMPHNEPLAHSGAAGASAIENGSTQHALYQDVALPAAGSFVLTYWMRWKNQYGSWQPYNQDIVVSLRDPASGAVLAELFRASQAPTPLFSGGGNFTTANYQQFTFDITSFAGRTVRLQVNQYVCCFFQYMDLDDIEIRANMLDQQITLGALGDKTFGDADFTVSATASSGIAVTFSAAGKCTVSGATVHLTGAGTCTITAHQPGNTSYQAAEDVARSFDIAKATATLALSALEHTYDGSPKSAAAATAPAGLSGVALTYDGSPAPPTNAGSYAVRATLANDDHTTDPTDGTLVIAKAPATITLTDPAPVYDGSAKQAGVSTSPAGLTGVTLAYVLGGSPVASPVNAGSYQVHGTLTNDNYEAPGASGTLTIGQATPAIQWAPPAPITAGTALSATQLNATATGVGGAGLAGSFVYTPAAGTVLGAAPAHQLSVAFTSSDPNYTGAGTSVSIAVLYQFSGFFQPVDNPTVVNKVKAGRAIPVKFSLGGNQGLDVLQAGSPSASTFSCGAGMSEDLIEETVTANASGLQYDATADQYNYVWKTGTGYANSCRKLTLTLKDGTRHEALFHFIK